MSTQLDHLPEPDPAEIAQRLRQYMGDKKISRSKLAMAAGIGRTPLGAKLDGHGEFSLNEILDIARALGRGWLWVMTGDETNDPRPPGFGLPGDQSAAAEPSVDVSVDSDYSLSDVA